MQRIKKLFQKLIGIKNIINMKYLFSGCYSIESKPDISIWNINKITNIIGL